ncbi:MAG: hypothetical protein WC657_03815 [Candidatus Paceibacterota bacterium]|jgi:hypothetical protein
MCEFFSFVTEPENHGGKRFYFDWEYRKKHLQDENDSHSLICKQFKLDEDVCNKYEFNPLTRAFSIDKINSPVDDRIQAEDWVNKLDFRKVIQPLIIKPIINPFDLPIVEITPEIIGLLKQWTSVWASVRASVRDSVWDSVGASVGASVWDSVGASVWASVRDSVWGSVGASVGASVWAYVSTFFNIKYKCDFSSCAKLWEMGIVLSFDGTTWRLHSGKDAAIVFEITVDELGKQEEK